MYPQKFSQSVVSYKPNLKNITDGICKTYLTNQTLIMIRQKLNYVGTMKLANKKIHNFIVNGKLYKLLKTLPKSTTKQQRENVLKIWAHHCECVLAQRLRRCHQMFCLYTRLWEERALSDFIKRMRQSLARKGKDLALGALGVSVYNWNENRIPLEDLKAYQNEFEYVQVLKENTICMLCDPSQKTTNNVNICECGTAGKPDSKKSYDEWVPYLEREDLVVWRKPHPSGLYEYKVYGSYDDVCAMDFLQTQVDMDYRRKWDKMTVMLEVAETDPTPDTNSDLIYWELEWPKLFANRDYVFKRRYLIDDEANMLYIISRSTEYSKYPPYKEKFRVQEYWSRMIIRPKTNRNMKELGIEFTLTYFDNPGLNVPSSVMTWATMKAMPDFLARMREATREYKNYCRSEGTSEYCRLLVAEERAEAEKEAKEKLDYCNFVKFTENIRKRATTWTSKTRDSNEQLPELNPGNTKSIEAEVDSGGAGISTGGAIQPKHSSFWKYFHPLYYFH
nr:unnamed protein product [Callosobruchus analis]